MRQRIDSWAERWAAPEPAQIALGDRPTYSSDEASNEGLQ